MKFSSVGLAAIGFLVAIASAQAFGPAPPNGKCKSWQSRCAMAAGGRCDPTTGRWSVSERLMTGYLACISDGQKSKK
jgi:hypothetical protein